MSGKIGVGDDSIGVGSADVIGVESDVESLITVKVNIAVVVSVMI